MKHLSERYVDGTYLADVEGWHETDSPWKASNVHKILTDNGVNAATICDVGCGIGLILAELQPKMAAGTRFTGYEISPQAYEIAKRRENDQLTFLNEDILTKELAEPYDVVLLLDVFEHVPDYLGFLDALRKCGRKFVFHIPLDIFATGSLRGKHIAHMRKTYGHLHVFDKAAALMTLHDTGFKVIDYFYTVDYVESSPYMKLELRPFWKIWRGVRKILRKINPDLTARLFMGHNLMVLAEPSFPEKTD